MYCAECHNPRPLSERPFANYQNVAAHMRVRANLTGKEFAKLMEFLHRWHDQPPPSPPVTPPPTRFNFSQPLAELREQTAPPQPLGNPGLHPLDLLGSSENPAGKQPLIVPAAGSSAANPPPSLGNPGLPPLDVRNNPDVPVGQLVPDAGSSAANPQPP
jgi:hypothetical protein